MRTTKVASLVAAMSLAPLASAEIFTDTTHDLFDNGFANLDIVGVGVFQSLVGDNVVIDMAIQTRGISDWTKYMVFLSDPSGSSGPGTGSNPWNRPVDLGGQSVHGFIGQWIDGSGGNQVWAYSGAWFQPGVAAPFSVDWANNTVHIGLSFSAAAGGSVVLFDVATSGGGNDPGVDHLSRLDMATSGWGSPSVAGQFLSFTVIPAPGAMALLGLAGLAATRRRR